MIKTARQLKDKVKNLVGDTNLNNKSQTMVRNFIMERFLERISQSEYRDNFILKGGMLVASLIGLDMRATMDIDTTVRSLPLTMPEAEKIIKEIIDVPLGDGVKFEVLHTSNIMEEHDYPGIRFTLRAQFDKMNEKIKIDISTGDVITPAAVIYSYKLMFEERSIPIYTYNIETLLAEKLETVMARGTANTRMRDFYDIHVILEQEKDSIVIENLQKAFLATSQKRDTVHLIPRFYEILDEINQSELMERDWNNFKNNTFFVGDLTWQDVLISTSKLAELTIDTQEMTMQSEEEEQEEFGMAMV